MPHDLPAGWTTRRPTLDDVPEILAVVHASDIAAVGEPDFTSDEVVEILTGPHHDPAQDSWLALDDAGRLVAWAYIDNPTGGARDTIEVYVFPQVGEAAQAHLLGLAVARVAERTSLLGHMQMTARAGAVPSETYYIGVLEAAGFTFLKRYARMRRDLTGDERPPALPGGVTIRTLRRADEADLRTFYAIIERAFADIPDSLSGGFEAYQQKLDRLTSVSWDEWWVAEVDGVPAGVLQSSDQGVEQDEGWVKYLAVAKEYRGRGLGQVLLRHAFAIYAGKGRLTVGLGVDLTNPTGAYRLYESVGMHAVYEANVYERLISAAAEPSVGGEDGPRS
jgi:mycothiol synthase